MKHLVKVPFVPDMGSISSFIVSDSIGETKAANALWHLNSMRDHDDLDHLNRMPNGTTYEPIKTTKP